MSNLVEELMNNLGGDIAKQMAKQLNIDENTAKALIPQVAPLILSGLKRQKDQNGGEQRVDHILNKYGNPSVLNQLGDLFQQKAQADPDPQLGGLLGESGERAANMIASQFKLDTNTAGKAITMLAPVVLGYLTKKRDVDGLGTSGLASMLDRDGDGSILDDVAGFFMKGMGGNSNNAASMIGGLLGGLFGGKK
jgi:hypothetical protein